MLHLQIIDDTCVDDEFYELKVPLDTPWGDIQTMVRLVHPSCTSVFIEVDPE